MHNLTSPILITKRQLCVCVYVCVCVCVCTCLSVSRVPLSLSLSHGALLSLSSVLFVSVSPGYSVCLSRCAFSSPPSIFDLTSVFRLSVSLSVCPSFLSTYLPLVHPRLTVVGGGIKMISKPENAYRLSLVLLK